MMSNSSTSTVITRLPREPFLPHSEKLLEYLLQQTPSQEPIRILEIGCGRSSPLVAMLQRLLPGNFHLVQVDARPEVVVEARRHAPTAQVEQAFANDLAFLEDHSVDLVIGMSVFDQNAVDMLPAIAEELQRVLHPGGSVVYLHNEELNLPASFASALRAQPACYLIPSLRWQPTNDHEFALVPCRDLDQALASTPQPFPNLRQYLQRLLPPTAVSTSEKRQVPLGTLITPKRIQDMQREFATLSQQYPMAVGDISTSALLANHVERLLFSEHHGFRITDSGVFEIQLVVDWRTCFETLPKERCFARGITRFGLASSERLRTQADFRQELNSTPRFDSKSQLLMTAYQYGMVA
ncbi:MAG: class I SAM-dependent methyltransferase, partial [bacterium]|nr:class I SAM-dependent methyltransferase [bacterium]